MREPVRLSGILFVATGLLGACASTTPANKAQTGAIVGTLAGAVIGAKISSRKDRAAGVALGAGLGGVAGYVIGRQLDERDRIALQARIDELARSSHSGGPDIWRSEHSGASAQIVVGESVTTEETTKRVVAETDVSLPSSALLAEVGPRYALANLNVRAGPGVSYPVKYVLSAGERVELAGTSEDGFDLISDNGIIVGYVSSKYLSKEPVEPKREAVRSGTVPEKTKRKQPIENAEPAARPIVPTREDDLRTSLKCKPVTIRLRTKDGQVTEEKTKTCMRADGTWGS